MKKIFFVLIILIGLVALPRIVSAQSEDINFPGISLEVLDGDVKISDLSITFEVQEKDTTNLASFLNKQESKIKVIEKYTLTGKGKSTVGNKYLYADESAAFLINPDFKMNIDGREISYLPDEIEGSKYFAWEFSLTGSGTLTREYFIEGQIEGENAKEKIKYIDKTDITKNINYSLEAKFLDLSFNNSFNPESELEFEITPPKIILEGKKNTALSKLVTRVYTLQVLKRSGVDVTKNSDYSKLKADFKQFHRQNNTNKDVQREYLFALLTVIGDSDDSSIIKELYQLVSARKETDTKALESKYLYLSNQFAGNSNTDFLPFKTDQNINLILTKGIFDFKLREYKIPATDISNFDSKRSTAQTTLGDFTKTSDTVITTLTSLYSLTKDPVHNSLLIDSNFAQDFASNFITFNTSSNEISINTYQSTLFDEYKSSIEEYLKDPLEKLPPQLLLNFFDKTKYEALKSIQNTPSDSGNTNNSVLKESNSQSIISKHYLNWVFSDIQTIFILLVILILQLIIYFRMKVRPFRLLKSLLSPRIKATQEEKPVTPEALEETYRYSKALQRDTGLMDTFENQ